VSKFPKQLFVTGTDTDVGKTLVSAALVWGLKAHYFKPFQSGCDQGTDQQWIQEITGFGPEHFSPETFRLGAPLSPNQAADLEGQVIDPAQVQFPKPTQEHLIIEGVGGLMVPLNPKELLIDWIRSTGLSVLLVARSGLGTLNHTLLSVEALKSRGIPLWGIVMSGPTNERNAEDIRQFTNAPILAQIDQYRQVNQAALTDLFSKITTP